MPLHAESRNAREGYQLIETYQTMVRAVLQGRLPQFTHTSRMKHHFFVVELLLQVVALEAYIYGTSRHYGFRIPEHRELKKKDGTKKQVPASLEFKTRFFLKKAKAKIYKARI